jgi:hypothetical protein
MQVLNVLSHDLDPEARYGDRMILSIHFDFLPTPMFWR